MSKSAAHAYLQRLLSDPDFLDELAVVPEGPKRRALARRHGYTFTEPELLAAKAEALDLSVWDVMHESKRASSALPALETARTAVSAGAEVVARSFYWDTTG